MPNSAHAVLVDTSDATASGGLNPSELRYLVLECTAEPGKWMLPGGGIDPDDRKRASSEVGAGIRAAVREIQEEVGISIAMDRFKPVPQDRHAFSALVNFKAAFTGTKLADQFRTRKDKKETRDYGFVKVVGKRVGTTIYSLNGAVKTTSARFRGGTLNPIWLVHRSLQQHALRPAAGPVPFAHTVSSAGGGRAKGKYPTTAGRGHGVLRTGNRPGGAYHTSQSGAGKRASGGAPRPGPPASGRSRQSGGASKQFRPSTTRKPRGTRAPFAHLIV